MAQKQEKVVGFKTLLSMAHAKGLESVLTEPVNVTPDFAFFKATVSLAGGKTYQGHGDASPKNVRPDMAPHLIRLAECVPLSARILTPNGWKRHDEIEPGKTLVLAYDLASNTTRWTRLLDKRVYEENYPTLRLKSRNFDVVCTPEHTWAVKDSKGNRVLRQAKDLRPSDHITLAARAESGKSELTPREAAILGWLVTDGTIRHDDKGHMRACIAQSKPEMVEILCRLLAEDATHHVSQPKERTFPSGKTYQCLPGHKFELRVSFVRDLLNKAGFTNYENLVQVVTRLSHRARLAMLDAMLQADGSKRGNSEGWTFAKKRKPGVMEAFEVLATLEGHGLGKPHKSSTADMPARTMRSINQITVNHLKITEAPEQPVWCPQTEYGTWVANLDGYITITGNTRAIVRALRLAVNIGDVAMEELADFDGKSAPAPKPNFEANAPISQEQMKAIRAMCDNPKKKQDPDALCRQKFAVSLENLSQGQAADIITELNQSLHTAAA